MKTIPDHLTPGQAWDVLCGFPALNSDAIRVSEAAGYILAESITATEDIPSAPRSFMDGYAVRAADVAAAPAQLKLAGEVLMGSVPVFRIGPGEAAVVPTGGFLPEGADAVVMQEQTEQQEGFVRILKAVRAGENVQVPAEDFRKGDLLFPAGHKLRSQDLSALATFGLQSVAALRRPELAIISTGNELVPAETESPESGKIRETNSLALSTAAKQFHFLAVRMGIITDEFQAQREAMQEALEISDVVLVSGGSSVGARDFTLEVIRSFPSHQIHFHGLAIRPGNPTIFASIGNRYVFGLPGQPVSSLIVFYEFVLPFLFHLSGEKIRYESFHEDRFVIRTAQLLQSIQPLKIRTDYARLRLERTPEEWTAVPVIGKSASLSTLSRADAFTIIPPGEQPVAAGTPVTAILFP